MERSEREGNDRRRVNFVIKSLERYRNTIGVRTAKDLWDEVGRVDTNYNFETVLKLDQELKGL